jgi:4-hydroxy-3-methylbut-2-enyl diphosphate reductase IspH
MNVEKVILAKPRGFCAGVEMAVETVERALKRYGAPSMSSMRSCTIGL